MQYVLYGTAPAVQEKEEHINAGGNPDELLPFGRDAAKPVYVAQNLRHNINPTVRTNVNPALRDSLVKVKQGTIRPKDRSFRNFTIPELGHALRRGSNVMHVHVLHGLMSRYRQTKIQLNLRKSIQIHCQQLVSIADSGVLPFDVAPHLVCTSYLSYVLNLCSR